MADASGRAGAAEDGWRLRPAGADDLPFLRVALGLAVNWSPARVPKPLERVLADPRSAVYVEGWCRSGDAGVVAEDAGGTPIGAAWYRAFAPAAPGYGFLDAATPELAIGVLPAFRGKGVGRALLEALLDTARAAGLRAVSLSVEPDNPARGFYKRYGFVPVGSNEGACTMRHDLARPDGG